MSSEDTPDEEPEPQATWVESSSGPDREGMVSDYLPQEEDWVGKTVLDLHDDGRVAALKNFHRMFPEVEEQRPLIEDFLDELMKGRTSVGGRSRMEIKDIFMAMFGGKPGGDTVGDKLAAAFAADWDDDD